MDISTKLLTACLLMLHIKEAIMRVRSFNQNASLKLIDTLLYNINGVEVRSIYANSITSVRVEKAVYGKNGDTFCDKGDCKLL